jgi:hypothetical protein
VAADQNSAAQITFYAFPSSRLPLSHFNIKKMGKIMGYIKKYAGIVDIYN